MPKPKSQKANSKPIANGNSKEKEQLKLKKQMDDMEMDDLFPDEDEDNLEFFWNLTIEPKKESLLESPRLICITKASFGRNVNKNSRTVVCCKTPDSEELTPLCVLNQGINESEHLDLRFGSSTIFQLVGTEPSTVYLTGYVEPEPMDDMDDMDDDDDFFIKKEIASKLKQRFAEEEAEEEEEPLTKKRKTETATTKTPTAKQQPPKKGTAPTPATNNETSKTEDKPLTKAQQKNLKKAKKQGQETNGTTEKVANGTTETKVEANNSIPLEYKDIKIGDGQEIQNGTTVLLYYVGQLENKKVFDKVLTGTGFEYKVGNEEPIKGWNLGLKGMKVGGKRRIVIPPEFGYGIEGSAAKTVPPNATLTYTIEIKGIKSE